MFRSMKGLSHVHFVGIGGAGMSGIAEVLLDYDLEVSGCDAGRGDTIQRLESLGVKVYQGHSPDHLDGVDLVVKSSAVTDDNEEIRAARARGITVVRRAEMLGELMRMKYGIAVAGTHGKTTTTSLISTLLTDAGLDPTVIVGGRMRVSGTGARVGRSDYLVAEADEFDRSFLRLMPILAVVTSIDVDHLDTYGTYAAIEEAFVEFASRVPFFGQIIVCLDDVNIQRILPRLTHSHRVVTYGLSPQADLSVQDLELSPEGCRFTVMHATEGPLGAVHTPLAGRHNVRNVLAAVAVGRNLQLGMDRIASSLAGFRGVHRRFERLGEYGGAVVIDDYAHHPTEVAATLQAARQTFPRGRIHAIFQPHLFSRTRDLAGDFGRSLMEADEAVVTAIYASRESPIEGVSGEAIVAAARASGHRQVGLRGRPPQPAGAARRQDRRRPAWAPATWCSPWAPATSTSSAISWPRSPKAPLPRAKAPDATTLPPSQSGPSGPGAGGPVPGLPAPRRRAPWRSPTGPSPGRAAAQRDGDAEVLPMRPREKVKRLKSPLWIRLLRPLAAAAADRRPAGATVVVWLLSSPSFALRETRFSAGQPKPAGADRLGRAHAARLRRAAISGSCRSTTSKPPCAAIPGWRRSGCARRRRAPW